MCLLYCAGHAKCIFANPLQISHACQCFWSCYTTQFCSQLAGCRIPCACHTKGRFDVQKWSEHVVFCTFWLGNGSAPQLRGLFEPMLRRFAHFDFAMCLAPHRRALFPHRIATSKSAPTMKCFVNFDFEICFAPQRRAIFHLSSGQLAPHPRFCEPTFRPSGAMKHWKNSVSRLFYFFTRLHLLSSGSFASLIFFLLLFSSLTLPTSAFSCVHIVGSLTSKLPSSQLRSLVLDNYNHCHHSYSFLWHSYHLLSPKISNQIKSPLSNWRWFMIILNSSIYCHYGYPIDE